MSEGLNRVIIVGNLGADPEVRQAGGSAVCGLRVAVAERYQDRDKQWQERTEWVRVTVWGKRGEALGRILSKGDRVVVEGSLRTRSYDKDGEKRYATEVVAQDVILCGGKRRESDPKPTGGGFSDEDYGGGSSDDLPF